MLDTDKQVIDVIKGKTTDDKILQEFLIALHNYEIQRRGAWMYKEVYKQRIRKHSQEWEAKNEN